MLNLTILVVDAKSHHPLLLVDCIPPTGFDHLSDVPCNVDYIRKLRTYQSGADGGRSTVEGVAGTGEV